MAADNGLENMRFPGTQALEISGSVTLKPPAIFASGDLGPSGGGTGISVGAGAPDGASVSARMSAGVRASAGAFNGLRAGSELSVSETRLDLENFIDTEVAANIGTDDQSSFEPGGRTGLQGSASLRADVGKAGELKARIEFDGD